MKKCPRCEINWIENDAYELCEICQKEIMSIAPQLNKSKSNAYFNEYFTFKSGNYDYGGKHGFKAYNSKGEHVGIVFMTDDKRVTSYGYCELHFFPQYYNNYGEWHRIISHGNRISWSFLCEQLKIKNEHCCFID